MESSKVSITEPHPSVSKASRGTYIQAGRGGAGNYKRYKVEDLTTGPAATGPASRLNLSKTFKRPFIPSGRGGSGNMYKSSTDTDERMFQFDEEMVRRTESQAPVYYIGRGGAANWIDERDAPSSSSKNRQYSTASADSGASDTSASSNARGTINKLTRRFS